MTPRPLVVGIGESLFDCFPDRVVLGGAPLNFAVHADVLLRPLGGNAAPLTRVGVDDLGDRLVRHLSSRGVSVEHVQRDPDASTGRVTVTLDAQGVASYAFDPQSAWDRLHWDEATRRLAESCDAVCFGTLGQRGKQSRDTIRAFLQSAPQALRLLDLNLREGFYDRELVEESVPLCSVLKVNEEELDYLAASFLQSAGQPSVGTKAERVADAFGLTTVAVTLGPEGAGMLHEGEWATAAPPTQAGADAVVDTVGAGDAFSAGLVTGLIRGLGVESTLRFACRLGAYVVTQRGATPALPAELCEP